MKKIFSISLLAIFAPVLLAAQASGDYRTAATGNWNAAGTWERFDGASWATATGKPTADSGAIAIRSGHIITVTASDSADQITIEAGGKLVVNTGMTFKVKNGSGNDLVVKDSLVNFGSITTDVSATVVFDSGGVYRHAQNGGSIPVATWNNGSTLLLTGLAGNAPANGNQNFYNVVWNNPGQSSNLNLGWNGNTIGGNITVVSSGASSRWQLCAPTAGNSATVTLNGDVNVSGGQLTTTGTSNANTTITINQLGNINVSGGNFSISRGSQGGSGTSLWNLQGNFTMLNATTQNSTTTPAGAKFVFTKAGVQTLKLGGVTFSTGGLPIQVKNGATLDLDTNIIAGNGVFQLDTGATIQVSNFGGLDSALKTTGAKTLSKGANYIFNGTVKQEVGALLPDTVGTLAIYNPDGVAIRDTFYCKTLNVASGAVLAIDTLGILVADTGAVNGMIWNSDSISSVKGFVFGNGAIYQHARNGGAIPKGLWEEGSLCKITGMTNATSFTGGGDQDFYNFEWNCPNQTANAALGIYTKAIHGNFTLTSSGSGRFYFMSGSSGTISLLGNFSQQSGNFGITGTGSQTFDTVNCYGNVAVTGGNWSVTRGSQSSGTGTSIWNMYGNEFSLSNTTTQSSNTTGGKLVFAKEGAQKLLLNNVTYGGGGLVSEALGATTLDLDTSVYAGSGALTVNSGATLISKHINGLNGNITTTGAVSLNSGANFVFAAAAQQVTGTMLPATVKSLAVDNVAGVKLSSNVTTTDSVTLTNGKLALTGKTLTAPGIRNASSARYIVTDTSAGKLMYANTGAAQALFPVGIAEAYAPVWLTNSGTADGFVVKVQPDTTLPKSGARVKVKWNISEGTAGGSNLTLKLGWMITLQSEKFTADSMSSTMIYDLSDTTKAGTGNYVWQYSSEPFWVSGLGITKIGSFTVGKFGIVVSVGEENLARVPIEFKLSQNYPNPFNPATMIQFTVKKEGPAKLVVMNILGQQVAEVFNGNAEPAKLYKMQFNGSQLSSGIYFSILESGGERQIKKMMLLK